MKNRTLAILASSIPYHKELRPHTGSVTASILMQQLDYWFNKYPDGFFKFISPSPDNEYYKEEDSWAEELGFSEKEFRSAFDLIGVRYHSKTSFDGNSEEERFLTSEGKEKFYCSYHDKQKGYTWYFRNDKAVDSFIDRLTSTITGKGRRRAIVLTPPKPGSSKPSSTVTDQKASTVDDISCNLPEGSYGSSPKVSYSAGEKASTFIYREFNTEITSPIVPFTSPTTPEEEGREERKFGFQIPEERKPLKDSSTTTTSKQEILRVAEKLSKISIVTPPEVIPVTSSSKKDGISCGDGIFGRSKYERFCETAHPALVYSEGETPWLEEPKRTQFVVFHKAFAEWGGQRLKAQFQKADLYQAMGDFLASLKNDPDKISIRWDEYQSHVTHHAATISARLNNGIQVGDDEKQKILKHQRAFDGASANGSLVDEKILIAAKPVAKPSLQVLESVATIPDDVWDKIADQSSEEQEYFSEPVVFAAPPPPGAEDPEMYSRTADVETREFYRKLHEARANSSAGSGDRAQEVVESQKVERAIGEFARSASIAGKLSECDRIRIREEESRTRQVTFWTNSLASGIPSLIADTERQVAKAGYTVICGQVCSPTTLSPVLAGVELPF